MKPQCSSSNLMFCAPVRAIRTYAGSGHSKAIRRYRITFFSGAILALAAASAHGEERFHVDAAASEIRFELGATGHAVEGTFHGASGDFTLIPQSGAMTGVVTVDATTGQSDNKSRDKKMTNDQLKAQTFPTVSFSPTKFSGQVKDSGDSSGQVDGTFTLLGQGHPISVPMTVHMEGDHFTASGSFQVPYVSWGVKDPSIIFLKVAKDVKISVKLSGTVAK